VSPGRWGGGGAHPNGGTTERRRRGLGVVAFVSGEGSPVVAGVVEEVLQLGRGEGVRKLQEIPGIGSSGKGSPGRGGWRRRSAEIREGEAGSSGQSWWSGCREWRGGSSARESGRRGVKNRVSDGVARGGKKNARRQRGREGKRGGERESRVWGCHAARGSSWGPLPTGGRLRQQPARARSIGDRAGERGLTGGPAQERAAVSLTGGVGLLAARGERGRGRERVWAGPRGEGNWAARLHSTVLELFELF
jgi:hypothetical protein